jgi:hypothetical protein
VALAHRRHGEPTRPVVRHPAVADPVGLFVFRHVARSGEKSSWPRLDPEVPGLLVQQARSQHVGEEMVVAIPPAAVVERDEEQIPPIERLQRGPAVVLARDGVTQRAAQAAENRGPEQEAPDMFGWRSRPPP